MNELITVQDLTIPMVSGNVSIPLQELDNLRRAAQNALTAAQTLESQQRMVKLVVEENYDKSETHFATNASGYDYDPRTGQRLYNPQPQAFTSVVKDKRLVSIDIINLGDIMPDLVDKATADVKEAWDAEVKGLENSNKTLEAKLNDQTKQVDRQRDDISRLEGEARELRLDNNRLHKELIESDKELKKLQRTEKNFWLPMQKHYSELIDKYNKLIVHKSFWAWVQSKIDQEGQPIEKEEKNG